MERHANLPHRAPRHLARVLGVEGEPYDPWLPDSVRRALGPDATGKRIAADFKVCPLTKEKPGHMQMVCVIGASHVTERDEGGH